MPTTGVLFSNALITATGAPRRHWARASEPGRPSRLCTIHWIPPVSRIPATTTYSAPTVITPWLENPTKASAGPITPVTIRRIAAPTNTKSGAARVNASSPNITTTSPAVNHASQTIPLNPGVGPAQLPEKELKTLQKHPHSAP